MNKTTILKLENGKYTYKIDEGRIFLRRFDDDWQEILEWPKPLVCLIYELVDKMEIIKLVEDNLSSIDNEDLTLAEHRILELCKDRISLVRCEKWMTH